MTIGKVKKTTIRGELFRTCKVELSRRPCAATSASPTHDEPRKRFARPVRQDADDVAKLSRGVEAVETS